MKTRARERVARVVLAALLATATGFLAPSPAFAHTEVCVGQGWMNTAPPLYYPIFGPAGTGDPGLFMGGLTGVCSTGGGLGVAGSLSGWCGLFTGSGTVNDHRFNHVLAGSMWILYAQPLVTPLGPGDGRFVVGLANVVPDAFQTPPQSCATGATWFLFTGAVAMIL